MRFENPQRHTLLPSPLSDEMELPEGRGISILATWRCRALSRGFELPHERWTQGTIYSTCLFNRLSRGPYTFERILD